MKQPAHRPHCLGLINLAILLFGHGCVLAFAFNPREYQKRHVTCPAFTRNPRENFVNISLSYVDVNPQAKSTLLMVHGWPGLWSTWSNQIEEFGTDYHLILPDLRGFGESAHPGDVRSSGTMGDLVGDLVCILQDAKVNSAICMGHDWGSQVCYEFARMRPDIVTAVVGAVVPGAFVPMKQLAAVFPKLTYQIYFDTKTALAISELDKDIRRTIRATLRSVDSPPPSDFLGSSETFLAAWNHVETIPPVPFLTEEEENYMVEQYSIQGFKYGLQFYMHENRYAAWRLAHSQGNYSVPQPVLAIYPENDPVANWTSASALLRSKDFIPRLTTKSLKGSHWVHLEYPTKFNSIVRRWLQDLEQQKAERHTRASDEL